MRACWTKVVDPYGPFENVPDNFVPKILHLEGEILGVVTKMWTTYFIIATDDGEVHEIPMAKVIVKVNR